MKCPKCGYETNNNICEKCGYDMSVIEVEASQVRNSNSGDNNDNLFKTIFSGLFDDEVDETQFPVDVYNNEFVEVENAEEVSQDSTSKKKKSFKDFFKKK